MIRRNAQRETEGEQIMELLLSNMKFVLRVHPFTHDDTHSQQCLVRYLLYLLISAVCHTQVSEEGLGADQSVYRDGLKGGPKVA